MGKADPVVHLFREGGGMVTKTHDIELATELMRAKLIEVYQSQEAVGEGEHDDFLKDLPTLQYGRIIPADTNSRADGYEWWWRPVYAEEIGKAGVTRAVVWN